MPCDYESIRKANIKGYGEYDHHLSFLGQLYSERTHFIFELLQNAEDAGAKRVLFNLFEDSLEVMHDGRPFDDDDVKGVCGVGEGTKSSDLTQIGKFGIGFKSVYAYTSKPEIHSGDEHFYIEKFVRPNSAPPKNIDFPWTTLFIFPFDKSDIQPEKAHIEISKGLRKMSLQTLLFLDNIQTIEYSLPDQTRNAYYRKEQIWKSCKRVVLSAQNSIENEYYLVFEKSLPVPDAPKKKVKTQIAFKILKQDGSECMQHVHNSPLFVFFPTDKATHLGFFIQGPYRTTPSRDNVPKNDEWNEKLVLETKDLIIMSLLKIKKMGLLTVSVLDTMPIRPDNFQKEDLFYPIAKGLEKAFQENEFLPTNSDGFVCARHAKLARGSNLRKLLSNEQLTSLMQSSEKVKWLNEAITQDNYPDLRRYLMVNLQIEEINPAGFIKKLSKTFIEKQPDDWMILFYSKIEKSLTHAKFLLRDKPVIRLENGSHVTPFTNKKPNAYLNMSTMETDLPVVKSTLIQDEASKKFLKNLGIPELDIVAEVIEKIVPKYNNKVSGIIHNDEHLKDIEKIHLAWQTDSKEKRGRLWKELSETPFIRSERQSNGGFVYMKPSKLYFHSHELQLYFSGNNDVGFVSNEYPEKMMNFFTDVGVQKEVRIIKKEADTMGYISIKSERGDHQRGIDGFDPDMMVEGLKHALSSPPTKEKSAFIWNKIAKPNARYIRGTIECASRKTFDAGKKKDCLSRFGLLLNESEWLPGTSGDYEKPCSIKLKELPEIFKRDEQLAQQLAIKLDYIEKIAEQMNISEEDVVIIDQNREAFEQWKESQKKAQFPSRTSMNPERRQNKLELQLGNASHKKYEARSRTVKTSNTESDQTTWLRNTYTNDDGQLICQICEKEMPFKKRNGEYYFEAVELLSKNDFPKEHVSQFIALCPLCAAKYKEFIKRDLTAMASLKTRLIETNDCAIDLAFGEFKETIRFVETHRNDIRTNLKYIPER
jgi:predicted house-cleaning noncanonical NTP pyrophosphatase (MazG superfamily)